MLCHAVPQRRAGRTTPTIVLLLLLVALMSWSVPPASRFGHAVQDTDSLQRDTLKKLPGYTGTGIVMQIVAPADLYSATLAVNDGMGYIAVLGEICNRILFDEQSWKEVEAQIIRFIHKHGSRYERHPRRMIIDGFTYNGVLYSVSVGRATFVTVNNSVSWELVRLLQRINMHRQNKEACRFPVVTRAPR